MVFEEYLENLPKLHSWDDGKTWNSGGFTRRHLAKLHAFLNERLPPDAVILETGAGNSTITFLFLKPQRLVSIAPDSELFARIATFCREHAISTESHETHVDGSQWVLPQMAAANRGAEPCLDFALIDGCHGWPTAFVDLEYTNAMLRRGGFIMIDDVQLHAEKEIARLLAEHPDFSLDLDIGKSLVFRKLTDARHLGEWTDQPYIVRRTNAYARHANPYLLGESNSISDIASRMKRLPNRIRRRIEKRTAR